MTSTAENPQAPPAEDQKTSAIDKAFATLGIDRVTVEGWKQNYGRVELVFIGDKPFIYRPLFRRELKALRDPNLQGMTDVILEDKVACLCTLAPKIDEISVAQRTGGLPATLAAMVYSISDFDIDAQPIKL